MKGPFTKLKFLKYTLYNGGFHTPLVVKLIQKARNLMLFRNNLISFKFLHHTLHL